MEVFSHYTVQKKDLLLKLNRIEVQRIIAVTTGHGRRFNAHLKKMNTISDSKCKFCEADETAKHIICVTVMRMQLYDKELLELCTAN